ncbi:PaaI family thioesterase [Streptomyces sp. NPDC002405]
MRSTTPEEYPLVPVDASDEEWRTWADTLPLAAGFDVRCVDLAPGSGEFVVESSPISVNPNGAVHGGVVAAVIDHALGAVCIRMVPAGDGVAQHRLLPALHPPGEVVGVGPAIRAHRRIRAGAGDRC